MEESLNSMQQRIDYLSEFDAYTKFKFTKSCNWGISHAEICILKAQGKIKEIFSNKKLRKFYRKRYFKDYIRLRYLNK